jgi:hypothetical protein
MTATIQDLITDKLGTEDQPFPVALSLPIEANKIIYAGTPVASNAAGNAVDAGDAGAIFVWGRAERQVNNLTTNAPYGAAGSQMVRVLQGVFYYAQDGSISQANVGQPCFFVDNATVSLNAGGTTAVRPFAGVIVPPGVGESGLYLATNTKVPVFLGEPSCIGMELRYTVAIPLATIQTYTSGTAFNVGVPLPTNARLDAAEINVLTPLSGGGATAVTAALSGGTDTAGSIITATSVFTGAQAVIATPGSNPYAARSGQQIKMVLTDTGGTLAGLTAGSLSVDIFYSIVA